MKKYAQITVFIAVLATALVPTVSWYMSPGQSQAQIFLHTWLFTVYSIVIYVIGTATINMIWDE